MGTVDKRKKSKYTEVQEPVPFAASHVVVDAFLAESVLTQVAANEITSVAAPGAAFIVAISSNFYLSRCLKQQAILYNMRDEPYLELLID